MFGRNSGSWLRRWVVLNGERLQYWQYDEALDTSTTPPEVSTWLKSASPRSSSLIKLIHTHSHNSDLLIFVFGVVVL